MITRRILPFALILSTLASAAHAQNSPSHTAQLAKDKVELQSYTLTMDVLKRAFMTIHAMSVTVEADPDLQAAMKKNELEDDEATIDQMTAAVNLSPKFVAIVTKNGFTPRSLAVAEICIQQTRQAVISVDQGEKMDAVISQSHVNPANVTFMREHRGEIEVLAGQYDMNDDDD